MFAVTIQCGDAAELRRLADVLEGFCTVQARGVAAQADAATEPAPAEAPRQPGRRKRKAAEPAEPVAEAAAPAPEPKDDGIDVVTDEMLVGAVRAAMRSKSGVPGVRAMLDKLGLANVMEAPADQRLTVFRKLEELANEA